jgi:hypothetical protein
MCSDTKYMIYASNSFYTFCEQFLKLLLNNSSVSIAVKNVIENVNAYIDEIFEAVFLAIFTLEGNSIWCLPKILLALAVINEEKYEQCKLKALEGFIKDEEIKGKVNAGFSNLFDGVKKSLTSKNKEMFVKNFSKLNEALEKFKQNN